MTESEVEGLGEAIMGVEEQRKVAMGIRGPKKVATAKEVGLVSFSLPVYLLLPASLLLLSFLASKQAFFWTFDKRF